MKKIFTFAIIFAAAAMVSCGGNANKTAEAAEVEEVVVETTCEPTEACADCEQADSCTALEVVATEAEVEVK